MWVLGPKLLLAMGCVKLGEKICVHLPSVGEQTANQLPNFAQPLVSNNFGPSTNHSCWEHFVELSLAADIWARHASKTTNGVLSTWLFSCLLCFLSNHSTPKNIELALYWKWSSRMYGMIVRPHRYVGTPTQTHNIQSGPLLLCIMSIQQKSHTWYPVWREYGATW